MSRSCHRRRRRGLSLAELLVVTAIMGMLAAGLGTLAVSMQQSHAHQAAVSDAAQHARVVVHRLEHLLRAAEVSEQFPGFVAFAEQDGSVAYPENLVVWRPQTTAVDPDGLPRFDELVIICPDSAQPRQLLEIRTPQDQRVVPPLEDVAAWQAELARIKAETTAQRVLLTNLLRTAPMVASTTTSIDGSSPTRRGAVRFYCERRPTEAELQDYRDGNRSWQSLPWPQGLQGVRCTWCRFELQLLADETVGAAVIPLPFFGSVFLLDPVQP